MSVLNTISAASIRGFQGYDVPNGPVGPTLYQILTNPAPAGTYQFGYSLAITSTGDRIIIGCRASGPGTTISYAFIYVLSGTNTWTLEAALSDAIPNSDFGMAVDISGDGNYAIVGAPGYGRAYTYQRSGSAWNLIAQTGGSGNLTGKGVAINYDGTWTIISSPLAPGSPGGGANAGLVRVYNRVGSIFSLNVTWNSNTAEQKFGWCVDIDDAGDTVVIGRNSGLGPSIPTWTYKIGGVWQFNPTITSFVNGSASLTGTPNYTMISKDGNYALWWNNTMPGLYLGRVERSAIYGFNRVDRRAYIAPIPHLLPYSSAINNDATKTVNSGMYYTGFDTTWTLTNDYVNLPNSGIPKYSTAINDAGTYKVFSDYNQVYIFS